MNIKNEIYEFLWKICDGSTYLDVDRESVENGINEIIDRHIKTLDDMPCVTEEEMQECKEIVKKYKPKAHWVQNFRVTWFCNKCGRGSNHKFNYCPNCGAEMESEDKK